MSKKKDLVIAAEKRDAMGTSNSRRLRHAGYVPAVVYAGGTEGTSITLAGDAAHALSLHSGLMKLKVEGEKKPLTAIVKDMQYHPITGALMHMDLQEVRADQVLTVTVTIIPEGEAAGVGVGGRLEQSTHDLEVRCLPTDIPEEAIAVDISALEIGSTLTVGEIPLPEGLTPTADPDMVVFSVSAPMAEEEETAEGEEAVEGEEGEPEVVGKGKTEEEGAE